MLDIALTLCPALLEKVFVGIEPASFARACYLRKACSVEVATNGITMQANLCGNRDLTSSLLMPLHHFFITALALLPPCLPLESRCRQWGRSRNRFLRISSVF